MPLTRVQKKGSPKQRKPLISASPFSLQSHRGWCLVPIVLADLLSYLASIRPCWEEAMCIPTTVLLYLCMYLKSVNPGAIAERVSAMPPVSPLALPAPVNSLAGVFKGLDPKCGWINRLILWATLPVTHNVKSAQKLMDSSALQCMENSARAPSSCSHPRLCQQRRSSSRPQRPGNRSLVRVTGDTQAPLEMP